MMNAKKLSSPGNDALHNDEPLFMASWKLRGDFAPPQARTIMSDALLQGSCNDVVLDRPVYQNGARDYKSFQSTAVFYNIISIFHIHMQSPISCWHFENNAPLLCICLFFWASAVSKKKKCPVKTTTWVAILSLAGWYWEKVACILEWLRSHILWDKLTKCDTASNDWIIGINWAAQDIRRMVPEFIISPSFHIQAWKKLQATVAIITSWAKSGSIIFPIPV
jgi:hypothetical protein